MSVVDNVMMLAVDEREFDCKTEPVGESRLYREDRAVIDRLHFIMMMRYCPDERPLRADINLFLVDIFVCVLNIQPSPFKIVVMIEGTYRRSTASICLFGNERYQKKEKED